MSLLDWLLRRHRTGGPGQPPDDGGLAAVADGPLGMKPYPLGDVLGGIAVAVTDAQYISDQYTEFLRQVYSGNNDLDALAIPNTQFERVRVRLKFAILELISEVVEIE